MVLKLVPFVSSDRSAQNYLQDVVLLYRMHSGGKYVDRFKLRHAPTGSFSAVFATASPRWSYLRSIARCSRPF